MEKIFHYSLMTAASFVALALFSIGIRNIRARRKPGPFMMALLIAFSLIGVNSSGQSTGSPVKSARQHTEKYPESRVLDLNKTPEWRDFKAFWKKLDLVVPKKKTEGELGDVIEYHGSIDREEAGKLRNELKELVERLKRLEQSRILTPSERELFERLCTERINQMEQFPMSMITRMIPPPYLVRKEQTIGNLERRIDQLLELKKNDKIDQREISLALKNIQKEIEAFSAYDSVSRGWLGYHFMYADLGGPAGEKNFSIDRLIEDNEKQYAGFTARKDSPDSSEAAPSFKEIEAKYKETRENLLTLKRAVPFINEAVLDLER